MVLQEDGQITVSDCRPLVPTAGLCRAYLLNYVTMPDQSGDGQTDTAALRDRFRGALLGTMVGDALGMPMEGMPRAMIPALFDTVRDMLPARLGPGTYTDDTQMMIGLAEAFIDTPGRIDLDRVASRFADNFDPDRGYGGNTYAILTAIQQGTPWRRAVAQSRLPGGSFANGAAMRVAPVALALYNVPSLAGHAAAQQAEVTGHSHPVAVFGAQLQALAVLRALQRGVSGAPFEAADFAEEMAPLGRVKK